MPPGSAGESDQDVVDKKGPRRRHRGKRRVRWKAIGEGGDQTWESGFEDDDHSFC